MRHAFQLLSILLISILILSACAPQTQVVSPPTEVIEEAQPPKKTEEVAPPAPAVTEEPEKTEEVVEAPTEPIKIGMIAGTTGVETIGGVASVQGAELAIEEINNSGGVNGQEVTLIVEDHERDTAKGMDAVHKLIDVDKVPVFISESSSSILLPAAGYADEQGVVVFNMYSTSPKLRELNTLISLIPLDDYMAIKLAEMAYGDGYRKAVTFQALGPFGEGVAQYATQGFTDLGGEVLENIFYTDSQADYTTDLQRVADLNPDVILAGFWGDDANLLLKQSYEMGIPAPWYSVNPTIASVQDPVWGNGRLFGVDLSWQFPEGEKFRVAWEAKYGSPPDTPWGYYAYDAVMLAVLAMKECGPSAECVLENINAVAATYPGVTGKIEFDEDFIRTDLPLVYMEYKDGELQIREIK